MNGSDYIEIKGAKIHNLKNIDINIPKGKLTVITGVSGSGKSSLAFDTLYEEGKRRYLMFSDMAFMVESAPAFESITGLSPTVAVEQRTTRQSNPRSTVGTRTKIDAMLAVLFANYGNRGPGNEGGAPLDMAMFQRNSAKGMCAKCLGAGIVKKLDDERLFGDLSQKVDDVILGVGKRGITRKLTDAFYKRYNISRAQRLSDLSEEQLNLLKYGDGGKSEFMGCIPWIMHITNGALSTSGRLEYLLGKAGYMRRDMCPKCGGSGLGEAAAYTRVCGKTITEMEALYINDLLMFFQDNDFTGKRLADEIAAKLKCLEDVGLSHLSLSRPVPTLSGGETQRLFLASYIIAEMDSLIFIFDEPTIGLHEVEKARLIETMKGLVRRGNTVIAVEHDENFMRAADYIVDLGPYAGEFGGERIFQGTLPAFLACQNSLTAPYLSGKASMPVKFHYRQPDMTRMLALKHCGVHNLRDVSVDIPLGLMVGVAGVSGSGKSSLITDTLVPKLKEALKNKLVSGEVDEMDEMFPGVEISGVEYIRKCAVIDQKPIGRNRTSCPATYTGIYDRSRALFAKESGMDAGMFTVNSLGGCRVCKGDGVIHYHVGMGNFVDIECETCGGTGFTEEALSVTLDGVNIRDILDMSVDSAAVFFNDKDKAIMKTLRTLQRIGMGYIKLGQKTPFISGGEAQRIKLAAELGKSGNVMGNIYILDEPTTGLSFTDIERLIHLMREFSDSGATVIVTEHDPAVLSNCDYIIEMGPGGGREGGYVIAKGTPTELKGNNESIIGRFLR